MRRKKYKKDLKVRTYKFSVEITSFVNSFRDESRYWVIADQLLKSSTSIGANVIEAIASSSKADFVRFYVYSLKSANETKYWLKLLEDTSDLDKTKLKTFLEEAIELSKILAVCILRIKGAKP